ncbi:MAG: hypothetical protein M3R43_03230 [Acidobacteriota bacterium]|nr:hypothetical protein [Acidobacteriota bacterium]
MSFWSLFTRDTGERGGNERIAAEAEYRKQRYDSYDKEREALRRSSLKVSDRYDKGVLAGSALALSVTFIEKIAPHPRPCSFTILAVAWALLILAIVLQLHALATSQSAMNEQLDRLDTEYAAFLESLTVDSHVAPVINLANENKFSRRTQTLNVWSLRALVAGIGLVCLFSVVNLPFSSMSNESKKELAINESKGSFVPPRNKLPPPPPPSLPKQSPDSKPSQTTANPAGSK